MYQALFQALGLQPWANRHSPFSQGELEGAVSDGHNGHSLWSPYYVPDPVSSHLLLPTARGCKCRKDPHFIGEEMEAQRGLASRPS